MSLLTADETARTDIDGALPAWMTPLFVRSGASERPPADVAAAPPAEPAPPAEVAAVPMVRRLWSRACDRCMASNRLSLKMSVVEAGGATKGKALQRAIKKLGVKSFRECTLAEQNRYKAEALQGPKRIRGPSG